MAEDRSGPHRRPRRIFTRPEMCLQARTAPIKGAASRWRGLCGNDPCKSIPDDRQASKSANGIGAKVHSRFAAELVGRLVGKLVARRNLSLTKLRHPVILFGDPGHRANLRSARLDSSRNSLFRPPRTGRPFFHGACLHEGLRQGLAPRICTKSSRKPPRRACPPAPSLQRHRSPRLTLTSGKGRVPRRSALELRNKGQARRFRPTAGRIIPVAAQEAL